MPTKLEVKFAKKIYDGFLQVSDDWNRDERSYYCEFCDADWITVWNGDDHGNMYRTFPHLPDCIVNDAKHVLCRAIGSDYEDKCCGVESV